VAVIKAGDGICRNADNAKEKGYTAYVKEHPAAVQSKTGQEELLAAVGVPVYEEELDGLQGLEPESGASEYKAILVALETGINEVEAEPLAVTNEEGSPLAKANQLAKGFGFKDCSSFQ
jgi:hypothetical protein